MCDNGFQIKPYTIFILNEERLAKSGPKYVTAKKYWQYQKWTEETKAYLSDS